MNKGIEIDADLKCPNCKNESLKLFRNSKSLSNPYILKCNKKECRKKLNLREWTFFGLHKKIPISVLIKIIGLFILHNKNGLQIKKSLLEFYQLDSINMSIIYSVISNLRKYIAHYLKEVYMTPLVESNLGEYVAVDESLFCHNHGNEQIW